MYDVVCSFKNDMIIKYNNFNYTEDCTHKITKYCSRLTMEPFKMCVRMSHVLMIVLVCQNVYTLETLA
jgi:hypothetical protein